MAGLAGTDGNCWPKHLDPSHVDCPLSWIMASVLLPVISWAAAVAFKVKQRLTNLYESERAGLIIFKKEF